MADMHRGKNYVPTLERENDKTIKIELALAVGQKKPTTATNSGGQ